MPRVDPRHSFGRFPAETSGLFGAGYGGIKLLETVAGVHGECIKNPSLTFPFAGQTPWPEALVSSQCPSNGAGP
jgi:hypothetical protein